MNHGYETKRNETKINETEQTKINETEQTKKRIIYIYVYVESIHSSREHKHANRRTEKRLTSEQQKQASYIDTTTHKGKLPPSVCYGKHIFKS